MTGAPHTSAVVDTGERVDPAPEAGAAQFRAAAGLLKRVPLGAQPVVTAAVAWVVTEVVLVIAGYLMVGSAGHGVVAGLDLSVARFVDRNRARFLVSLANLSPALLVPFALLAAVRLWRPRESDPNRITASAVLGTALGGGYALVELTKHVFARPRPPRALAAIADTGYSFPSAHVTMATVGCVTVALLFRFGAPLQRRVWAGCAVVCTVIAASRLLLGVHWLSDVTFGLLFGTAWSVIAFALITRPGTFRHPDGAGGRPRAFTDWARGFIAVVA